MCMFSRLNFIYANMPSSYYFYSPPPTVYFTDEIASSDVSQYVDFFVF